MAMQVLTELYLENKLSDDEFSSRVNKMKKLYIDEKNKKISNDEFVKKSQKLLIDKSHDSSIIDKHKSDIVKAIKISEELFNELNDSIKYVCYEDMKCSCTWNDKCSEVSFSYNGKYLNFKNHAGEFELAHGKDNEKLVKKICDKFGISDAILILYCDTIYSYFES